MQTTDAPSRPTRDDALGSVAELLRPAFRVARGPLNSLALRKFRREGLPMELYPALEYWLTDRRPDMAQEIANRVETIRGQLGMLDPMTVAEYGASLGAPSQDDSLAIERRGLDYVARRASVPMRMGTFLYLCAEGFGARRILELGTCAGISGCYLASAPACRTFVSIEISSPLSCIAKENLSEVTPHATVINAPFDEGIGQALELGKGAFDLVWIDGHHESEPTLRYFERLRDHVAPGKLMLFDDINWPEMRDAWQAIRAWPGFSHTLNAERFGIAVLKRRRDIQPPQNWKLERRLKITNLERE